MRLFLKRSLVDASAMVAELSIGIDVTPNFCGGRKWSGSMLDSSRLRFGVKLPMPCRVPR